MRTPHPARLSPLGVLSCKHPDPDPDPRGPPDCFGLSIRVEFRGTAHLDHSRCRYTVQCLSTLLQTGTQSSI